MPMDKTSLYDILFKKTVQEKYIFEKTHTLLAS